jgi:hypothetical protein
MPRARNLVAPSAILPWVQDYAPEFEKRWNRFVRQVRGLWRVDEAYAWPSFSGAVARSAPRCRACVPSAQEAGP